MATPTVDLDWIRAQKKAELHVHLFGAIRPGTALELAEKHRVPFPIRSEEDWIPYFTRGGLAAFVEGFIALFEIARTEEDFFRIAVEAAEDWSREGVAYTEPRLTLTSHFSRGVDFETVFSGLEEARKIALERHRMAIRWIVDFPRILGPETGRMALDAAERAREFGVVGFDIAGYEGPYGEEEDWRRLFLDAKDRGLRTTAHAGEVGSPLNVRRAVEDWKVDRIGHGVRAVEDPALLDLLSERGIPIEVSPTCNVLLGNVSDLESHPLEIFRQKGIPIILNTDDPTLFGVTLSEEIHRTATTFGWDRPTTLRVIENGWVHRFGKEDVDKGGLTP